MDRKLLDLLICPTCRPAERPLRPAAIREADGDILSGHLDCPGCGHRFPIDEGVAVLLTEPKTAAQLAADRYESPAVVAAYLWSHFGDLLADPEATDAYARWAGLISGLSGPALDVGCAVGRLTFELGRHCEAAVGLDRSLAFVRLARRLKQEGSLAFRLPIEGRLDEPRTVVAPSGWRTERTEFLVADAQSLPFPQAVFAGTCSLNLVDKLPRPLSHLQELNRVARQAGARLLFADPFSWSEAAAPAEEWLGGTPEGPFAGRGRENVRRLLEEEFEPPWRVAKEETVRWKLRSHRNHFELIRSETLLAGR